MTPARPSVLAFVAIVLEARSHLANAGISAATAELLGFARLVWLAEQRERELEFVDRVRGEQPTVN
jgi:hypothetical protein